MNTRAARTLVLVFVAATAAACSRGPVSGPPELRLGRDICAECGMIINEDRCSTAALVEVRARREYVMFDDTGCMIDYEHANAGDFAPVERYVHDYGTRAWVPAAGAHYVFADRDAVFTPMGSGIVAFAARGDAEAKQREIGGEVLDYPALAAARREWMAARYGERGPR